MDRRWRTYLEENCAVYEEFEVKCVKRSGSGKKSNILRCKYCCVEVGGQANRITKHLKTSKHVKLCTPREEISTEHWSREVTKLLIQLYKQHDFLYDTHSSLYHDKYKRLVALHSITVEIAKLRPNTTVEQVKSKMANLRKQFSTELKRLTYPEISASFAEDGQPVLWCFEQLQFLKEFVTKQRRETFNPVTLDEEDLKLDTIKEEPLSYSPSTELPTSQQSLDSPSTSTFSFVDASDPKINYTEPLPEPPPDNIVESHFSKFVCSSLGSIRSPSLRRLAIKRINDVLFEIQEMDDAA